MGTLINGREAKIVELSQAELAVRIMEAMFHSERPHPDADTCLAGLEPDVRQGALQAAVAAMEYLAEAMKAGGIDNDLIPGGGTQ